MTAPLAIRVDPAASTAPFEQIREQITALIAAGELPVGSRLPPVRALAETLGVATGTVARAYRELAVARVVETQGRAGTVVSAGADEAERELHAAAMVFADRARALGVSAARAAAIVEATLASRSSL